MKTSKERAMDYTGKMGNVERRNNEYGESLSFTLAGKHFVSSGDAVVRTLSKLVDKEITLTVRSTGNEDTDWLITNDDHRFVEEIREIATGRYEIHLGS
jgi:hypothetical protein